MTKAEWVTMTEEERLEWLAAQAEDRGVSPEEAAARLGIEVEKNE